MRRRTNNLAFRVSDAEVAMFRNKVKRSGISQSAYFLHLIKSEIPQEKPPPEYFDIKKELRAIGNNMNQIAMIANATGIIDAYKYDDAYALLIKNMLRITEDIEMPKEAI